MSPEKEAAFHTAVPTLTAPEEPTTAAPDSTRPPPNDRLSIPFNWRLPLTTVLASFAGFGLGLTHGGQLSGLRFRAENAHRLPTSQVGWYLYHKSKNYHIMLGGIKEGFRMGARLSFWTAIFFVFEEAVDRFRGAVVRNLVGFKERRREERQRRLFGDDVYETPAEQALGLEHLHNERGVWVQRDFMSTVVAAMGTAGGFSAWNRFPVQTAARTATMGLKFGLVFGLMQDALSVARGRRVGYVEFVRRQLFGAREESQNKVLASPI
ncbi:unnamed protein product [Aureobasidium mustum]|uniref:Uncharacterized protein n=1 Tax=Aureobasidium mustum TaxID=2773714 RepID=A0A9N8K7D2_9PEZI|nr:unnamed protein product [Aureobasidium mustum]